MGWKLAAIVGAVVAFASVRLIAQGDYLFASFGFVVAVVWALHAKKLETRELVTTAFHPYRP